MTSFQRRRQNGAPVWLASEPELAFSRNDVTEIQLAKGDMRASRLWFSVLGVTEADLDEVIIAGAFGTYPDVKSGIDFGTLPRIDQHRFKHAVNAACAGARLALLSVTRREQAQRLAANIDYVELTTEKTFSSKFARGLLME